MFGVEPGEIRCDGCRSSDVFVNCGNCLLRTCAASRGIEFCIDCREFPCAEYRRIASFGSSLPPHFLVIVRNLAEIREKGADEWRRLQVERWTCPDCGAPYSWYAERCACGTDVSRRKDWLELTDEDKSFFTESAPSGEPPGPS